MVTHIIILLLFNILENVDLYNEKIFVLGLNVYDKETIYIKNTLFFTVDIAKLSRRLIYFKVSMIILPAILCLNTEGTCIYSKKSVCFDE